MAEHGLTDDLGSVEKELRAELAAAARQRGQLARLVEMSELLQACTGEADALGVANRYLPRVFEGTDGGLFLCERSDSQADLACCWGDREAPETLGTDDCWALRTERSHSAGANDERCCKHLRSVPKDRSFCYVLTADGENYGILSVSQRSCEGLEERGQQQAVFEDTFIQAVGDQIARTLGNLRLRESLRIQSIRDPITGLFNRRYLEDTLIREIARAHRTARPMSVLMLDIDHFKAFNDAYGHPVADRMLAKLGELLAKSFRVSDVVCRYGTEAFVVLMPDCPLEEGLRRAEDVCKAASHLALDGPDSSCRGITVSVGVACVPRDGSTGDKILRSVDNALYAAKDAGRNCVRVTALPSNEADTANELTALRI